MRLKENNCKKLKEKHNIPKNFNLKGISANQNFRFFLYFPENNKPL